MEDGQFDVNSEHTPEEEAQQPGESEPENIVVESGAAVSVTAGRDANIENSMAMAMVAGNDLAAGNSLGGVFVAGRDLTIQEGGGAVMVVGDQAILDRSTVGILFAGSDANLTGGSKVLMTGRQALALGVALGASFALLTAFLRRLR